MFVKICGVTSEEDALLAVAMGADAVGFVFAPSPRQVTVDLVRDIVRHLPSDALTVGVFRNERPEQVAQVVNRAGLRGAQLHGSEPISAVRYVRERVGFVIRGMPAGHHGLHEMAREVDILLLDGGSPGSGQVFDWAVAEGAPDGVRLMLAGGLNPGNVASAIRAVRPWGVDVSTGVESSPGRKDPRKVLHFIEASKQMSGEVGGIPEIAVPETPLDRPFNWEVDA